MKSDGYPTRACADCLEHSGGRQLQHGISWDIDYCGNCHRRRAVTSPANFGNPHFKKPQEEVA